MVLRLQRRLLIKSILSSSLLMFAGLALVIGGLTQRLAIPIALGLVTATVFGVVLLQRFLTRLELRDGVLRFRSLFEDYSVAVSEITRLEPSTVSWRNPLTGTKVPSKVLVVCVKDRESKIWLNPVAYGAEPTRKLLRAMGHDPTDVGL